MAETTPSRLQVAVVLLIFCSSMGLFSCSSTEPSSKAGSALAQPDGHAEQASKVKALQGSLQETADKIFSILKSGSPDDLLPFFSQSGTVFEIDGPSEPKTLIEKAFKTRSSYYCLFFDTRRLRVEDEKWRKDVRARPSSGDLYSLRDQINRGSEEKFNVVLNAQSNQPLGQISIRSFRLLVALENGKWRIVNVESD
jgi:hypothetical protein